MKIISGRKANKQSNRVILIDQNTSLSKLDLNKSEIEFVKADLNPNLSTSIQYSQGRWILIAQCKTNGSINELNEDLRVLGYRINRILNKRGIQEAHVSNASSADVYAFAEGIALSNYQFTKYLSKSNKEKVKTSLKSITLSSGDLSKSRVSELNTVVEGTLLARTLVNEPLSYLTAVQFAKDMKKAGAESGFKVKTLGKKELVAGGFGGILAVNRGSERPPTFTIMEWKPKKANNKKPIVLVGKGVVYDTGGLSLKPTPNSMDIMKCDMGGAAAVVGAMYAVSKAKLPFHVIGLVPACENRPGKDAYVPGDVVKMHNKLTVEVLNTDAEGRMLLADALSYSKRYKPGLVIDLATLTGASARALGQYASSIMGTAKDEVFEQFEDSGYAVHERVVRFPFWKEYGEMMHSDIADLKNIGGPYAGMITAGKFLENFTDYPWVHIDIAGPAYLMQPDTYRGKFGTGVGVRLLFDFIKSSKKIV